MYIILVEKREKQDKICGFKQGDIMSYQIEIRKHALGIRKIYGLLPKPHIHSEVEIIYLTKGKTIAVLNNQKHKVESGDLLISFPNQIHYYEDQEPTEGYLIIFSVELYKELKEVLQTKVPTNPILHADQLPLDIENRMDNMYQKKKSEMFYEEVVTKGLLMVLMGEILSELEFIDNPGETDSISRILKYCVENYKQPIDLEIMSKDLYMSKYHISHLFHERMKMSYRDFINQLRIEYACELLNKGRSITEIAYTSGFSSTRTFNRAFLKHKETTPREYMKKIEI